MPTTDSFKKTGLIQLPINNYPRTSLTKIKETAEIDKTLQKLNFKRNKNLLPRESSRSDFISQDKRLRSDEDLDWSLRGSNFFKGQSFEKTSSFFKRSKKQKRKEFLVKDLEGCDIELSSAGFIDVESVEGFVREEIISDCSSQTEGYKSFNILLQSCQELDSDELQASELAVMGSIHPLDKKFSRDSYTPRFEEEKMFESVPSSALFKNKFSQKDIIENSGLSKAGFC